MLDLLLIVELRLFDENVSRSILVSVPAFRLSRFSLNVDGETDANEMVTNFKTKLKRVQCVRVESKPPLQSY